MCCFLFRIILDFLSFYTPQILVSLTSWHLCTNGVSNSSTSISSIIKFYFIKTQDPVNCKIWKDWSLCICFNQIHFICLTSNLEPVLCSIIIFTVTSTSIVIIHIYNKIPPVILLLCFSSASRSWRLIFKCGLLFNNTHDR